MMKSRPGKALASPLASPNNCYVNEINGDSPSNWSNIVFFILS